MELMERSRRGERSNRRCIGLPLNKELNFKHSIRLFSSNLSSNIIKKPLLLPSCVSVLSGGGGNICCRFCKEDVSVAGDP